MIDLIQWLKKLEVKYQWGLPFLSGIIASHPSLCDTPQTGHSANGTLCKRETLQETAVSHRQEPPRRGLTYFLPSAFCLLLSLFLVFSWDLPVMAQPQLRSYTQAELEVGDELAKQAFKATNKGDFATAERYWTKLIERFPTNAAVWSNRGNSRVSQNKLEAALEDFNKSIELAPYATDPYLNRGTALEGLGRWEEAIADYNHVLELDPQDAMAYNNRGNAKAGLRKWSEAIADYRKAIEIAPNFAFARANYALAIYEIGDKEKAVREMRNIVRKYPKFADMRAALTAAYWVGGKKGEAESNWVAAYGLDSRYKDINWVKNIRRWPPSLVAALDKFLNLK